jgi:hypothetical protein
MFLDRVDHTDPKEVVTLKTPADIRNDVLELNAKRECETLSVFGRTGTLDHSFNEQLRQCFAKSKETDTVNWQATLELRKKLVTEYEWRREIGV